MSSGANIGDGGPDGIGDDPTDMGVWELFQLGWLDAQGDQGPFYDVAYAGETVVAHAVHERPGDRQRRAGAVHGAAGQRGPLQLGAPKTGEYMFWSTQGDNLNTTMTKTGVAGSNLTAQVNYEIEADWDYAFLEASTDGGTTWAPVATNLSDTAR